MLRLNCDKPVSDGRRSRGTKRKPPPNLRRKRIWRLSHDHDSTEHDCVYSSKIRTKSSNIFLYEKKCLSS